jgi:hypothetical protein
VNYGNRAVIGFCQFKSTGYSEFVIRIYDELYPVFIELGVVFGEYDFGGSVWNHTHAN